MIDLDKSKLIQYKALLKEEPKLEKELDRLYRQLESVPVVIGQVMKSGANHPYIEGREPVLMYEPKKATEIKKRITMKEGLLKKVKQDKLEIEEFIIAIPDSSIRQIFQMVFVEGKIHDEAAEELGYSRSRITQIIGDYLKD